MQKDEIQSVYDQISQFVVTFTKNQACPSKELAKDIKDMQISASTKALWIFKDIINCCDELRQKNNQLVKSINDKSMKVLLKDHEQKMSTLKMMVEQQNKMNSKLQDDKDAFKQQCDNKVRELTEKQEIEVKILNEQLQKKE